MSAHYGTTMSALINCAHDDMRAWSPQLVKNLLAGGDLMAGEVFGQMTESVADELQTTTKRACVLLARLHSFGAVMLIDTERSNGPRWWPVGAAAEILQEFDAG